MEDRRTRLHVPRYGPRLYTPGEDITHPRKVRSSREDGGWTKTGTQMVCLGFGFFPYCRWRPNFSMSLLLYTLVGGGFGITMFRKINKPYCGIS